MRVALAQIAGIVILAGFLIRAPALILPFYPSDILLLLFAFSMLIVYAGFILLGFVFHHFSNSYRDSKIRLSSDIAIAVTFGLFATSLLPQAPILLGFPLTVILLVAIGFSMHRAARHIRHTHMEQVAWLYYTAFALTTAQYFSQYISEIISIALNFVASVVLLSAFLHTIYYLFVLKQFR